MKLCTDTITVLNRRIDPETRMEDYIPTVINGVSWYSRIRSGVGERGLNAANEFVIRIPEDADFGGKTYVDPVAYREAAAVAGVFTLANDDIVVKGTVAGEVSPGILHENNVECFTILGVTDNRRAPNAPHFKVVGE